MTIDKGGDDPQAEVETDDLASELGKAWDEGETAEDTVDETPPAQAAEEAPAVKETPETPPAGKDEETPAEPAGEPDPVTPPKHWAQADKDLFEKLPEESRKWFLDKTKSLEAGYDGKFKDVAEQRKRLESYDQIDKLFEPHRDQLRLAGLTEPQYIGKLMAADRYLRETPGEAIKWLAENYRIDLNALVAGKEAEADMLDPVAATKLQSLETQVSTLTSQLTQRQQQEQQSSANAVQARIDEFRSATDAQGQPAHPHFDAVRGHMSALINSGAAADLDSAYDKAVWALPDVRTDLIARQTAEAARKAQEQRKSEVGKAKVAARNVKGDPAGKAMRTPADTHLAELERNWDELSSE